MEKSKQSHRKTVAEFDFGRGKKDALEKNDPKHFGRAYLEGYKEGEREGIKKSG